MRWSKSTRLSKEQRLAKWHHKFLWTPHLIEEQWVWLETVERRSRHQTDGWWVHEYRFPTLFSISVPFDRYPGSPPEAITGGKSNEYTAY